MRRLLSLAAAAVLLAVLVTAASAGTTSPGHERRITRSSSSQPRHLPESHWCNTNGVTCAEPYQNWSEFSWYKQAVRRHIHIEPYIGHDEPSLIYYSNKAGSGSDNTYHLVLPKDPPVRPQQDGSGGTWNFQLHPAFWFGMALCDDQGAPNPDWSGSAYPNVPCQPGSDANVFTSLNQSDPNYVGKHPGTAYMEMQFYPPGGVPWPAGNSCDAHRWCAAINIWSLSQDMNTGTVNNDSCMNTVGVEPGNFAYITNTGKASTPANPLNPDAIVPHLKDDFLMKSGDALRLHMFDSTNGFRVVIHDTTSHSVGQMTASVQNGFGSVAFDPSASTCSVLLHAWHPEYSTASPQGTSVWGAHTYNVAYSDEIGHFEYCSAVDPKSGTCTSPGGFDTGNPDVPTQTAGGDDDVCFDPSASTLIKIGYCIDTDGDFDGPVYDHTWPGSIHNLLAGRLLTPQPILFTSPTFKGGQNYSGAAFEADLPRIEAPDTVFAGVQQPCLRHIQNPADPTPGLGCVNPPPQSRFYPFFTTTNYGGSCWWQEGGQYLPNTKRTFGGVQEYGKLLVVAYPTDPPGTISTRYQDFNKTLVVNPCPMR